MSEATKVDGKRLGRRAPDRRRPVLKLAHYLTGEVPEHPVVADHMSEVGTWNGATNFNFGTCGPCSSANHEIMTWKYLLGEDTSVADEDIYALYRLSGNPDFDPATDADDNGVDMTVMLSALVKNGIKVTKADGSTEVRKPLAFASVDVTSIDEIRAATDIFGGVLFGVTLETAQQAQTDQGLWDYHNSPVWGGHAVFGGAYTSSTTGSDEKIVTWEEPVGTTDKFMARQAEECYVLIWEPIMNTAGFEKGIDRAALAADFKALTGKEFPADPGPVTPPVTPPDNPPDNPPADSDPDLDAWAAVTLPWTKREHYGPNRKAAAAAITLLEKKGYE